LEVPESDLTDDPSVIFDDRWKPIARTQRLRREHGQPLSHRLGELPNLSSRSERLLGPLQGLLVDG
jgi:hypothetical protein